LLEVAALPAVLWRGAGRGFGERRAALPGLRLGPLGRDPPPRGRVKPPILTYMSLRRLPRPGPPAALALEVDPGTPRRALGRAAPWRSRPAPDSALGPARAADQG